jgi:NAD(P)-dependent dehydrogenase (short-subunit alcohol dehydrogenase family)
MPDLTGRTALITGATSGQAVVEAIGAAGGSAVFLAADLVDAAAATDLAARATQALGGRVDILVNNAGVFPFGPTTSIE